jgi:hypothetical protein
MKTLVFSFQIRAVSNLPREKEVFGGKTPDKVSFSETASKNSDKNIIKKCYLSL